MSIEWAINRGDKVIRSKGGGKKKQIFHCLSSDLVWESTSNRKEIAYFTREDLSYYGFDKKVCKKCK